METIIESFRRLIAVSELGTSPEIAIIKAALAQAEAYWPAAGVGYMRGHAVRWVTLWLRQILGWR